MDPRTSGRTGPIFLAFLLAVCLGVLGLTGCGGEDEGEEAAPPTATAPETTTSAETATGSSAESCPSGAQPVSSQSNIFGAGVTGYGSAPSPGRGGGGEVPRAWKLPASAGVVSFPYVEGRVTPVVSGVERRDFNGPEGDGEGPTNIQSYGGISGIVHRNNGMFLVGVFLSRKAPADPAPARLDFSNGENFKKLSPEIAQTFFVGDGQDRVFRIPQGATRLFLGFADGALYQGLPGYYGNNAGGLCVQVKAT
jgi:hypothetical protein